MDFLKDQKLSIILIFLNALFLIRAFEKCYIISGMQYGFIIVLFLIGIIIYWFYEEVLRKPLFKILVTIAIGIAVTAAYMLNVSFINTLFDDQIVNNLNSVGDLIYNSQTTYFFQYKSLLAIILPIAIAIMLLIASKGLENSILFITYTFMLVLWYTGFAKDLKPFIIKYIFVSIFTFGTNAYLKNRKKLNKRGIRVAINSKFIIFYALIFSFIISSMITISPQQFKGKGTLGLQGKIENAFGNESKAVKEAKEKEEGIPFLYDIAYSGYDTATGKLGGPINLNYDEVFKVKSDKPYYLRGIVKDYYDGFTWKKSKKDYEKYDKTKDNYFKDTIASTYFGGENTLTIYPTGLKTSTYFAPNYSLKVEADKGNVFFDNVPTFMSNKYIEKAYTVKFNNIDPNADVISPDVNDQQPVGTGISDQYYEDNYKDYLQYPESISMEIKALVYDITKDCKTNFQKVQAIKKYLSSNYKYSLEVSEIPKDREFVDYFLNVEKKGYCTYFATATTIFCRIAGIPARYVEGFYMTGKKDSKGLYVVGNDNCHAWTEVLLLSYTDRGLWYTADCVPNANEEIQKQKEKNNKATGGDDGGTMDSKGGKKSNIEDDTSGETSTKNNKVPIAKIASYSVLAIMIIYILLVHLIFLIRKNKMMKAASAIPMLSYASKRLTKVELIKPKDVTEKEFLEQINDSELKNVLKEIVPICYEEFYGGKSTKEFDRKYFYKVVERYVRGRQNIALYYLRKYYF